MNIYQLRNTACVGVWRVVPWDPIGYAWDWTWMRATPDGGDPHG